MPHQKLESLFAWLGFGIIQLGDWSTWLALQEQAHPDLFELGKKVIGTVICATIYHFVLRFWKKREQ